MTVRTDLSTLAAVRFAGHLKAVRGLCLSATQWGDDVLASAGDDGVILFRETRDWAVIATHKVPADECEVAAFHFSARDGRLAVVNRAGSAPTLVTWKLDLANR